MRVCSGQGCLRAVPDDVRLCAGCAGGQATPFDDGITEHQHDDAELDALPQIATVATTTGHSCVDSLNRMCARCNAAISEIVDHIVRGALPYRKRGSVVNTWTARPGYFLRSNCQGLCRPCHWLKTDGG